MTPTIDLQAEAAALAAAAPRVHHRLAPGGRTWRACPWCKRPAGPVERDRLRPDLGAVCPIDLGVRQALARYARLEGKRWKIALRMQWLAGWYISADLHRGRLELGCKALGRITPAMLRDALGEDLHHVAQAAALDPAYEQPLASLPVPPVQLDLFS